MNEFQIAAVAGFAIGLKAQLALCLTAKRLVTKLIPSIVLLLPACYSALRSFSVIVYPTDGTGFIDVGPLIGIFLAIFTAITAGGCLIGFFVYLLVKHVRKRKKAQSCATFN